MLNSKIIITAISILVIAVGVCALIFEKGSIGTKQVAHKTEQKTLNNTSEVKYLPLGDSYTIGQSEPEAENFPNQLVNKLRVSGTSINIVDNPSVTGYTTQDLINKELPLIPKLKPTFVTILIGVNDYVQGVSLKTFQSNLDYIINDVQKQLPNPKNIILVTIPDFSKTPTGAEFGNPATLEMGVESFNNVIKSTAANYKLPLADIFPISQGVANDPSLIADDGLHPSPKEYSLWVNIIYATIQSNLHL